MLLAILYFLIIRCSAGKPPLEPPSHLEDEYTLHQKVPLASYYVDDSNEGHGSHYKFSAKHIDRLINKSIPDQLSILRNKGFAPLERKTQANRSSTLDVSAASRQKLLAFSGHMAHEIINTREEGGSIWQY